jgi:chemotaxis protein methyltransferase CheR
VSLTTPDSDYIRHLVHSRAAIVLDGTKEYLIESRLAPLARENADGTVAGLVEVLRRQPLGSLSSRVIDAMTTNETSFFRDQHPFQALRTVVLPRLIRARTSRRELTIWCGGASSGQEPYSLAMLLAEHFPELAGWRVSILATDISQAMLDKAERGLYSQMEVNRGLPAALLSRYFRRDGHTHFHIDSRLRERITFRIHNLIGPFSGLPIIDVAFLRNVLIYFDLATKRSVLDKVAGQLRPDGAVFLGSSETTLNVTDIYQRVTSGTCGWYELKAGRK